MASEGRSKPAGLEVEGLLVGGVAGLGRLDRRDPGLDRLGRAGRGRGDGRGGAGVLPRRGGGGGFVVGVGIGRVRIVVGHGIGGGRFRLGGAARLARGRGGGRGFGDGAGGFGGALGPFGAARGVLLGGPSGGVGEVAQAQADGVAQGPEAEDQEQPAGDPAPGRNVQGGEALGGQPGHAVAPQAAEPGRQRPGGGRGQGRQGGRQQEDADDGAEDLEGRGLQPVLQGVADGDGQTEGDQQQDRAARPPAPATA